MNEWERAGLSVQLVVEKGLGKGTIFRLLDGINTLGRDEGNRIALSDPKVSRNHCKIRKIGKSLFITDLKTRNGSSVNGERLEKETELEIGDRIFVGNTLLKVVDADYEPQIFAQRRAAPVSFFRTISMAIFGRGRNRPTQAGANELHKLPPRRSGSVWKPPAPTSSGESRRKNVITTTDPD